MAIALDTSTYGSFVNPGTSLTWSHTVTGSNPVLLIGAIGDGTFDDLTSIAFNGVTSAIVQKGQGTADRWMYLYVLAAPATGAHNIVITGGNHYWTGFATSYTGVDQSTPIDSSAVVTTAGATSITTSTTVVASNCWLAGGGRSAGANVTAGTGTTNRAQETDFHSGGMYDSNGTVGTGSQSLQITWTGSSPGTFIVASLAPSGGAAAAWGPLLGLSNNRLVNTQ